jgi:hypothetical protein
MVLPHASPQAAPPGEQWEAYSKTATAITGNVTLSPDRITFGNGKSLPLSSAGTIPDYVTVWGKRTATLFRVTTPDDPVLLHGTRLCGKDAAPEPVTFIVVASPHQAEANFRSMDVFSSSEPPKGVENPNFCGNYNFERPAHQAATSGPAGKSEWKAAVSNDRTLVNIQSRSLDGKTMFYGGCNTRLGSGLSGSIEGYAGTALGPRVDDANSKLVFKVRLPEGNREFAATAHYVAPDKAWVWSDRLPPAFIDAFGRGDLLTVSNARGEQVADFDLQGAGKAIETIHRVCR